MIKDEDFLKWKENKVTKAFLDSIKYAQGRWEQAFLHATPHFETIGGMAQLQGRIEVCKEIQSPELCDSINSYLEQKEDSDGSGN